MSRLWGIALFIFIFSGNNAYSCTTMDKLQVFNPDVELVTLFFYINNSRKESLRMGITEDPKQGTPLFTLFGCVEHDHVDIRKADEWLPQSCAPLSPIWMPLYSENKNNEVVNTFKASLKSGFEDYLNSYEWDPSAQKTLMMLNAGINLSLGYGLQYYAKKFKPTTRTGKFLRWGARGAGWTLVVWSLWGGAIDFMDLSTDDSRFLTIDELTQLIQGMEENYFFYLDGSELHKSHRPTQVNTTISMIKKSIKKASVETYKQYCGNY